MRTTALKDQKGTIFLATLIITFLMVLMGGFIYQLTTTDIHTINRLKYSTQAQQLADAGLHRALSLLNSNWNAVNNASNFPLTTLNPGTYQASVTTTGGRYLVSSIGSVKGVNRSSSAEVSAPGVSALNYFLAGGSSLSTLTWNPGGGGSSSSLTASSNIYSASNASVTATSQYAGNIYAAGQNVNCNGNCTGQGYGGWKTAVGFPVVTTSFYQNIASANGQYFNLNGTGTQTYNGLPASVNGGIIYVNGNVQINDTGAIQTTTVSIVATGNITFGNRAKVKMTPTNNYPALMTTNGNITFNSVGNAGGGGSLNVTGLIYSGNNLSFSGNHDVITINGSALARGALSISFTAQTTLTGNFVKQNPPGMTSPSATARIVSYNS